MFSHIEDHGDAELKRFHQYLNQQNRSIKFTMEEEIENQLPFLDVLVRREEPPPDIGIPETNTYEQIHQLQLPPPPQSPQRHSQMPQG